MGIFRGNVKFMGILSPKLWFIFFGLRASTFLDVCWFCQPCLSHVEAACSFIPFRFFLAYGSFFALNIMIIAEIRRIPGLSSCLTLAKMGSHWAPIGLPLGSHWARHGFHPLRSQAFGQAATEGRCTARCAGGGLRQLWEIWTGHGNPMHFNHES